jgi:hypothetical protein
MLLCPRAMVFVAGSTLLGVTAPFQLLKGLSVNTPARPEHCSRCTATRAAHSVSSTGPRGCSRLPGLLESANFFRRALAPRIPAWARWNHQTTFKLGDGA